MTTKAPDQQALAPAEERALASADQGASMFERLARDPSVDVDKLERLMALHERLIAKQSEDAFNTAMSEAQSDMSRIRADAFNSQTKSRYATYAALDTVLRPIYTRHGFALSFDTGADAPELHVRVLCYVTHKGGHSRTYRADIPADGKGAKGGDVMTRTHAVGAGMQYGMRYLLKMIWNVAVGDGDDDGNAASPKAADPMPAGYENWLLDIESCSDNGLEEFSKAWHSGKDSPDKAVQRLMQARREYALKHDNDRVAGAKAKAEKITKGATT